MEVEEQLLEYLDYVPQDYGWERSNWTLELLARQLALDTGVELSDRHVLRALRQCGCRRGRRRPGLRIPVRGRRRVLENIDELVANASPEEEVFYQDEADAHLNPKLGATYMKPGQQLVVLTPGKNVKRYVFGALSARTEGASCTALHRTKMRRPSCSSWNTSAAITRWRLGYPEQAFERSRQGLALARALAHPFSLGRALVFSCLASCLRRDHPLLLDHAGELLALSTRHGMALWKGWAQIALGIGMVYDGDGDGGHARFLQGNADHLATGARAGAGLWPILLADAHARNGDAGLAAAALEIAVSSGDESPAWHADLLRIKGDVAVLGDPASPDIEATFRDAVSLSSAKGLRAIELRAATSLARWYSRHGRREEGATLLAPVLEGFTEGFDTVDLVAAQSEFDALSSTRA